MATDTDLLCYYQYIILITFQRRQEELERRARDLERREEELKNTPYNGKNYFHIVQINKQRYSPETGTSLVGGSKIFFK